MGEAPMSSLTLWWNWPSWMMVTVLTVHQVSSDLTSVGRHWGAHFCQVEAQAPHVVSTGTAGKTQGRPLGIEVLALYLTFLMPPQPFITVLWGWGSRLCTPPLLAWMGLGTIFKCGVDWSREVII